MSGDLKRKKIEDEVEWDISKINSFTEIDEIAAKRKEQLKEQSLETCRKESKTGENVNQMLDRLMHKEEWVEDDCYTCRFNDDHKGPVYRPTGMHSVAINEVQCWTLCRKCLNYRGTFRKTLEEMETTFEMYVAADKLSEFAMDIENWDHCLTGSSKHCHFKSKYDHLDSETKIYRLHPFKLPSGRLCRISEERLCNECLNDKARLDEFITETVNKVYSK